MTIRLIMLAIGSLLITLAIFWPRVEEVSLSRGAATELVPVSPVGWSDKPSYSFEPGGAMKGALTWRERSAKD